MSWTSNFNLLNYASIDRLNNAAAILSSYYRSRFKQSPTMQGLPISASIEPTTACNLRCPQCPSGLRSFTRDTGKVDLNLYSHILNELGPQLWYLTLYFQGEPFLHPQFHQLVEEAHKRKIYTATSSNAHFLNDENSRAIIESGLDKIIISVDGLKQSTYEKYRISGKLSKVEEGLNNLSTWKKKLSTKNPHIVVQFIVMRHNEHEIGEVKKWALKHGADEIQLKTAQIYDHKEGSALLPDNEGFARYEKDISNGYKIKNQLLDHCWRMWHSCVITWDGNVVPCCFDKDAKYVMGNVSEESFENIWKNEKYNHFRKQLLNNRKSIDICQDCTEGTKVWI